MRFVHRGFRISIHFSALFSVYPEFVSAITKNEKIQKNITRVELLLVATDHFLLNLFFD